MKLRTLLIFLNVCALAYFTYRGVENFSTVPKWATCGVLALMISIFQKYGGFLTSRITISWFLFVLVYLIGALYSYNPWQVLVFSTPLFISPLIASQLIKFETSQLSLVFVILLSPLLLIIVYELLGWIIAGSYSREKTYELQHFYGHRNHLAQLISLGIPLALIGLPKLKSNSLKVIVIGFTIISLLAVGLIQNRTSSILCFIVYPIVAILIFVFYKIRMNQKAVRLLIVSSAITAVAITILLVNVFQTTSNNSGEERLVVWQNSIELIKEKPFLGHGTNDWKVEIQRMNLEGTQAEEARVFFQRAHNIFLQTWAENGIVGFSFLLLFFGILIVSIIKKISNGEYYSGAMILCGALGFILFGLLSFPLERIELLVIFFLMISLVYPENETDHLKYLNPLLLTVSFVVVLVSFVWLINENRFVEFKRSGNLQKGLAINSSLYTMDATSIPTNWYIGNLFFERGDYRQALNHYRIAETRNPFNPVLLNNLAGCEYQLGDKEKAYHYYEKVLNVSPFNPDANLNLAVISFNDKNFKNAIEALLRIENEAEPENFDQVFNAVILKSITDQRIRSCLEKRMLIHRELMIIKKIVRNHPKSYIKSLQLYCDNYN